MRPSFNPRFEVCGFHPEEIVARRRDLNPGAKCLYDRMVRWARLTDGARPNERAGEVWRSRETMAEELGKSPKQVGRYLNMLKVARLIDWYSRDGRKSNTYVFLIHPDFEQAYLAANRGTRAAVDGTVASFQAIPNNTRRQALTGHERPVKSGLKGHPCPTNQKEVNQKKQPLGSGRSKQLLTEDWGEQEQLRFFGEQFWPSWPRKVARLAAEKAWLEQASTEEQARRIVKALHDQLPQLTRQLQYCPYPAKWLSGRRYQDEGAWPGIEVEAGTNSTIPAKWTPPWEETDA